MNALLISMISLFTLASPTGRDAASIRMYRGDAVDLKQRAPLYVEEHEERYTDGRRNMLITTYRDTEGRVIAKRSVDFSRSTLVPDFRTEDVRSGYMEGAERVAEGVRLYWRKTAEDPVEEKIVNIPSPAVVDAGFNNFVQERWDSIMDGQTLEMNFGLPFALDYYQFRLYKDEETVQNGRNAVVVRCEIDSFILRLFVQPIILVYDIETRRLVSYKGISNINDETGKSLLVNIEYNPFGP